MTAPTPNVELLRRTLAHIEAHPTEWDQLVWRAWTDSCGTAMCFAGWTAQLAGGTWAGGHSPFLLAEPGDPERSVITLADGSRLTPPWVRAARLLGLDEMQANRALRRRQLDRHHPPDRRRPVRGRVMMPRTYDEAAAWDQALDRLARDWPVGADVRHRSGQKGTVAAASPRFPVEACDTAGHAIHNGPLVAVAIVVDGWRDVAWYRPYVLRRAL